MYKPDSRDDARGWGFAVVHLLGGQGRHLEERAAGVQQPPDPLADQQLAAALVPRACPLAAALRKV